MKSLILGSEGLVGSALVRKLRDNKNVLALNHEAGDILNYDQIFKVFADFRPNVVYLAAANANVDACENKNTDAININGSINVLRLCEQFESKLVFFSSGYVFDGSSKHAYLIGDETFPVNNYGIQKECVERHVLSSDISHLVVRTIGVFGVEHGKKNFAKRVISTIFKEENIFAPEDQYMNPILSDSLAEITIKLADQHSGIFHVAGSTCISKYEWAKTIAKYFDLEKYVLPVKTVNMKQTAKRPRMGCLDTSKLRDYGITAPSLEKSMLKFLEQEYNGE